MNFTLTRLVIICLKTSKYFLHRDFELLPKDKVEKNYLKKNTVLIKTSKSIDYVFSVTRQKIKCEIEIGKGNAVDFIIKCKTKKK